jgi:tRNA nucleotidyltransferase (CCA-adding enzyme)
MRSSLQDLTKERVFKELEKALKEKDTAEFFLTLKELNVLDILFPEIYEMIGVEHNNKHHLEGDVFNHTILCLKNSKKDPLLKYAVLYHDIGKPISMKKYGDFYSHTKEELIEEIFASIKERYKVPNKYINIAKMVALYHHKIRDWDKTTPKKMVKQSYRNFFPKNKEDFLLLLEAIIADNNGRITIEDKEELNKEKFLKIFMAIKNVKLDKDFLKDSPSVALIKDKLHKDRISEVKSILKRID